MASATGTLAAPSPLSHAPSVGWLRNAQFDFTLIAVVAIWALAAGAAIVIEPSLFWPILFLDVWLLGYTHVISTFTRLAFDRESFRQHRLLLIPLPIVVAGFTIALALVVGEWLVATVYLYAQWFHYTRQSYGISRMYLRKAGAIPASRDWVLDGVIYALPFWGILTRSHQQPTSFLSLPIYTFPVPTALLYVVGTVATVSVTCGSRGRLKLFGRRRPDAPHSAYVASHIAIFAAGYLLIDDINTGWLVLNIWHNLQYVLIVWMFNANRFEKGIEPQRRFLSTISQPRNVVLYAFVCWALGTALYFNIDGVLGLFSQQRPPAVAARVHDHQLPPLRRRCDYLAPPAAPAAAAHA